MPRFVIVGTIRIENASQYSLFNTSTNSYSDLLNTHRDLFKTECIVQKKLRPQRFGSTKVQLYHAKNKIKNIIKVKKLAIKLSRAFAQKISLTKFLFFIPSISQNKIKLTEIKTKNQIRNDKMAWGSRICSNLTEKREIECKEHSKQPIFNNFEEYPALPSKLDS